MEFSQNYLFFYDQLEKANLFLQGVIDTKELPFDDRKVDWLFSNPLSDGGQFTGVSNLITKYGLVPSEAMPETYQANNTSQMANLLKLKLREDGLALRKAYEQGHEKGKSLPKKDAGKLMDKVNADLQQMNDAVQSAMSRHRCGETMYHYETGVCIVVKPSSRRTNTEIKIVRLTVL